jgi:hypothetical protein
MSFAKEKVFFTYILLKLLKEIVEIELMFEKCKMAE